jgi:hypothetical protein
MGKNLQAALERSSRGAAVPASVTPIATPVAPAASAKPASRKGKVHIGGYLPADFKRSLMLVRAQTGEDVQTLIAKALNDLFRAHNVPVVDDL